MSKFKNTLKSKYYWTAKGQGKIYGMLNDQIKKRGDSAILANKIGSTPGYVSQILSGDEEINPTWRKIVSFCLALDKVPILEIKDIDAYMNEENIKASYNMFHQYCAIIESDNFTGLTSPINIEIEEFQFTTRPMKNRQLEFDNYEDEYQEYQII